MKILGINISHDFSICIYENDEVKNIWYEERFNLDKHWSIKNKKFKNHIISIVNKINFKPDFVCYSSYQRGSLNDNLYTDEEIIKLIQKQLDNPPFFFNKNQHHIYHALCSFYFSKFDEAMAIVVDGGGAQPFNDLYQEIESIFYLNKKLFFTIYQHLSNRRFIQIENEVEYYSNYLHVKFINNIQYAFSSNSIGGYNFSRVCSLIGLKSTEAGKLMGLSSYGYSDKKYNLNYKHVELAKEAQEKSFNDTCKLIQKAHEYKKIKNFVLSGGYFLNCSNNFKYVKKFPDFNFFVDPIPSDGGTSIGACIFYDKYK
jgi:predicted NodU family carbamoyl transferase